MQKGLKQTVLEEKRGGRKKSLLGWVKSFFDSMQYCIAAGKQWTAIAEVLGDKISDEIRECKTIEEAVNKNKDKVIQTMTIVIAIYCRKSKIPIPYNSIDECKVAIKKSLEDKESVDLLNYNLNELDEILKDILEHDKLKTYVKNRFIDIKKAKRQWKETWQYEDSLFVKNWKYTMETFINSFISTYFPQCDHKKEKAEREKRQAEQKGKELSTALTNVSTNNNTKDYYDGMKKYLESDSSKVQEIAQQCIILVSYALDKNYGNNMRNNVRFPLSQKETQDPKETRSFHDQSVYLEMMQITTETIKWLWYEVGFSDNASDRAYYIKTPTIIL